MVGEAGLWYESLRHVNEDGQGLQNWFRQQYSKIGNTWEQLFHACRSFHFDKNIETLDSYVTCIRQVTTLLDCGKLQIWKYLKTHFLQNYIGSSISYRWSKTSGRNSQKILMKEKIDN